MARYATFRPVPGEQPPVDPVTDFVTNFVKWGMGTFLVGLPIAILILVVMCW